MPRRCRQITLFTKVRLLATETKEVDVKNSTNDDSPRPPIPEAIQTGLCLLLGIAGFVVQRLPIDSAFGWSLIPLIGAYAFGGFQTSVAAISSLARRELNVDSLMIFAAIGAAILGEWVEGVVLLFLFSLSGTLEKFASYRTSKSIESLVKLRPSTATRVLEDTNEDQVVAIDQLNLGDKVRVKPGERFPVDGTVLEGESWADESTLTGESVPVSKQKGSPVFSGTLNSRGTVVVEMTKLIADSTIERIVHMVHNAQSQKTPTQKLVESWQQPYVLSVLIGATVVFFGVRWLHTTDWSDAFYHAMVILVAASPCAVVLSSPAVMLSAIALAGRHGILVKGGVHLEQLGRLDVLAMDKTGTITSGHPSVTEVWAEPGCDVDRLLGLAALVEKQSEHPLAIPIIEELSKRKQSLPSFRVTDFHSHTGLGVHANIDGLWVGIGREKLFESHDLAFPQSIQTNVDRMRREGKTALPVITSDPSLYGVIAVADPLRRDAASSIKTLRELGVPEIVLLTGDHLEVASAIAKGLELDEVLAGLMPEDKVKHIHRLGAHGKCVAMIGDGVNDAPALASASVGIAMGGGGTDVALEVADVVLMRDNLSALPQAVWIGRIAHQRSIQNLTIAFGMISILVLLSFFELPMWLGVLGHEGSTLVVVFNGVRLLWAKVPQF